MRILTIDPGLDGTGVADWILEQGHFDLSALDLWKTVAEDAFPDRLYQLFQKATEVPHLRGRVDLVVLEKPAHGGMYRRSEGRAQVSVQKAMYFQNCCSGAMVAGFRHAGIPIMHLEPTGLKKEQKQLFANLHLERLKMVPAKPRKVWGKDELDAVAIGLQISSDLRLRALVSALATKAAA